MSEFNLDNMLKEKRKAIETVEDEKHKMKMELDEKIVEIKRLEKQIDELKDERSKTQQKHIQDIADKDMEAVRLESEKIDIENGYKQQIDALTGKIEEYKNDNN
eukprot:6338_1